jgi:ribosomal protein S18 acetylase RimI-like enzyme
LERYRFQAICSLSSALGKGGDCVYSGGMSADPLHIRPYRSSDGDALWEILAPPIQSGETFALPRDMSKGAALDHWSGHDRHCFVAERKDVLLGSYYVRPNQLGGGAHVANSGYATRPEARGQGIARAMCVHSLEFAFQQGFKSMQFNFVVSSNLGALTLWQRCGFEIVGRLPQAFLHPRLGYVDAVVMVRRL